MKIKVNSILITAITSKAPENLKNNGYISINLYVFSKDIGISLLKNYFLFCFFCSRVVGNFKDVLHNTYALHCLSDMDLCIYFI